MTQPLYLSPTIRTIEQKHAAEGLMAMAGKAVAEHARRMAPQRGAAILIIAGPGNNGGDAFVAARHLRDDYQVCVVFRGERARLPEDAAQAHDAWLAAGGTVQQQIPQGEFALAIDGLFGIGLSKPLQDDMATLVQQLNALACPILAIDIPSGLEADTGRVLGVAVRADITLTFIGLKPGLFTLDGPDLAGEVILEDFGLAADAALPNGILLDMDLVTAPLQPRLRNVHKGSFGNVGVIGGADGMVGAAILAGRAALLSGSGRVYAGLLAAPPLALDVAQPELMLRSAEGLLAQEGLSVLAVGPGMGLTSVATEQLQDALHYPATLVLDADALTRLALNPGLRPTLIDRAHANIMTPHPGEAARLLECTTAEVQADRIASALRIAQDYHAVTVLKGAGSVIATPDGRWFINPTGNPGMASAGMGDVLTGMIAGLAAQGLQPLAAVLLGVYLDGAAADALVARGIGPIGLTASELLLEARSLLNSWIHSKKERT